MAPVVCDIEYEGLEDVATGDASFTLSHGTSPSSCTMTVVHPRQRVPRVGKLRIVQDNQEIASFRNCAIAEIFKSDAEAQTYTVKIVDRRWMWVIGGGVINGHYNIRRPDGKVLADTKKSPRQLAKLCLEALGERNFDVSQLPDNLPEDEYQEVVWDHISPVAALDEVINKLGCRVVLTTKDRVVIVQVGRGNNLPRGLESEENESLQSVAVPDSLLFIAEKTRYQGLLRLEPVALDLDGKYEHADDVSYKPEDGWEAGSPEFPERDVEFGANEKERERAQALCKQTMWRTWRISGLAHQPAIQNIPGYRGTVSEAWQIELLTELVDSEENPDGSMAKQKPYLVGTFLDYELGVVEDEQIQPGNTRGDTRFPEEIQVDAANGLIRTPRPFYKIGDDDSNAYPDLYVYIAFHVKDKKTRIADRYTYEHKLPVNPVGSKPQPLREESTYRVVKIEHEFMRAQNKWTFSRSTDNNARLDQAAKFYCKAKEEELRPDVGEDKSYGGFVRVELDGAIQQVTWNLSSGVGTTRASRNTEHSVLTPRYKERELLQNMRSVAGEMKRFGWRR